MTTHLYVAIGALAVVLIPAAWRHTSHIVTLVHEAGHAFVAVLTGRRLKSVRLHSDTSGLTVSHGRVTGLGMIATAAAGYLAPSVVGLTIVALISFDRPEWSLYFALAILAFLLIWIRNWFGLFLIAIAGASVWFIANHTNEHIGEYTAWFLGAFFLLASPRAAWDHVRIRNIRRQSDSDVLSKISVFPAWLWSWFFLIITTAALVWGVHLLNLWPLVR